MDEHIIAKNDNEDIHSARLRRKHGELDGRLRELQRSVSACPFEIMNIKRQKLALKDAIVGIRPEPKSIRQSAVG